MQYYGNQRSGATHTKQEIATLEAGGCEYNPRTVQPEEINICIPFTIGTFIECYPLFEPKFIPKIDQKTARSSLISGPMLQAAGNDQWSS